MSHSLVPSDPGTALPGRVPRDHDARLAWRAMFRAMLAFHRSGAKADARKRKRRRR
jgi:hypothetical protein